METALGMANWLLGQVLNKLSDDLVKAYVSSTELGSNLEKIEREMLFTKGLLDRALKSDVTGDLNLQRLLERLGKKADEAEDALDELQYFMIQDKHDGTREATLELGGSLAAQAQHVRHAARHTAGGHNSSVMCEERQNSVARVGSAASPPTMMEVDGSISSANTAAPEPSLLPSELVQHFDQPLSKGKIKAIKTLLENGKQLKKKVRGSKVAPAVLACPTALV